MQRNEFEDLSGAFNDGYKLPVVSVELTCCLNYSKGFWRRHVIQEVPVELAACEMCGVGQCPQEKWLTCSNRIFHEERETAYRQFPSLSPHLCVDVV